MLHIEHPTSLDISLSMPLSTRVVLPVSALEQMTLSHSHSNRHSPPPQGEDMVTDKDQAASQVSFVSFQASKLVGCGIDHSFYVGYLPLTTV